MEDTTVEQSSLPTLFMILSEEDTIEFELKNLNTPEDAGEFLAKCMKTFQGVDDEVIATFEELGYSHAGTRFTEAFYSAIGGSSGNKVVRPSNAKRGYIQ